jgi:hypothetical protein
MDTTTNPPFTGIYNFRDVGHVVNSLGGTKLIRDKFLYRSGRLDGATPADREKLVSEYDLRSVIDLRTKSEHIKQTQTLKAKNRYLAAANVNLQTDAAVPDQGPWTVRKINFAGRNFEMNMLRQLKWWQIMCDAATVYSLPLCSTPLQMASDSYASPV